MFRRTQYLASGLALLLMLMVALPVLASELGQQQQQVEQQMLDQQGKTAAAQQQVDSMADQLRKVDIELEQSRADYRDIQAKLSATQLQIKTNTVVLATSEKRLAAQNLILSKRIRDIYQNGQLSYLDVLLGANDFSDFTSRVDILERVVNRDLELVLKVKAERALILQTKEALDRDQASILELKQAVEVKKIAIEASKKQKESVLETAVNDRDASDRAYRELAATSQRIEDMIRRSQSPNGGSGTGAMIWPTESRYITSPFGSRSHPIFGSTRFHSGLDIGADYGDSIVAADSGVVISAGWMGGYGKTVVIDHGSSVSTLYGHNSELLVSEGQRVRKGDIIARAGSTGNSTGPHSHFEVRENGSPVDPMGYL